VPAERLPGLEQVLADEAEPLARGLEPLGGEVALVLDLGELGGGGVELGLQSLLTFLGGGQVVGAAWHGDAEDERGHQHNGRGHARSRHVSPPSGARIEMTAGAPGMGEFPGRWQRTIAQPPSGAKTSPGKGTGRSRAAPPRSGRRWDQG
jgi:hypothetical protein